MKVKKKLEHCIINNPDISFYDIKTHKTESYHRDSTSTFQPVINHVDHMVKIEYKKDLRTYTGSLEEILDEIKWIQ